MIRMEALRTTVTSNIALITKLMYIAIFLVVFYFIYQFLYGTASQEVTLLNVSSDAKFEKAFDLPNSTDMRVKQGGAYTLSFWMYITSWDYRAGLAKSVLQIYDPNNTTHYLLNAALYPNETKLMVRVHTAGSNRSGLDINSIQTFGQLLNGTTGSDMFNSTIEMPTCDIQDIDLQRWVNVTVSVNGRIVDVYYDGKLTRSCVLPDVPSAPNTGRQQVIIGRGGGFAGKMSGIQFFSYPLTPDHIYSIYQAGPQGSAGFMSYVAEKLGIKLVYAGRGGEQQTITV